MSAKVPPFSSIGATAREVLSGSAEGVYQYNKKFAVTSKTSDGPTVTSTLVQTDSNSTDTSIKAVYKTGKTALTGTFQNSGKILLSAGVSDVTPGLALSLQGTYPDITSTSKVNVDYTFPHATLKGSVSLAQSPVVDAALTLGDNSKFIGADVSFSSNTNNLTKWILGAGYTAKEYQVGVQLLDKGQTVRAVYAHRVDATTTLAAEASHPLQGPGNIAIVLGGQKRLDSGVLAKIRVDDKSVVSAHLEGLVTPKVVGALSVQWNAKDNNQAPRWGFAANTTL